jgi:ABC-type transporter Mla MlaB component
LRVTILQQEGENVTLRIEGKVAGLRVPELDRAWRDLAPSLGARRLQVDLRGVTHVDETGQNLLAEIYAHTGAEFLADTPLTKYFAERAQQEIRMNSDRASTLRRQS